MHLYRQFEHRMSYSATIQQSFSLVLLTLGSKRLNSYLFQNDNFQDTPTMNVAMKQYCNL